MKYSVSSRELEILRKMADGTSVKEIADEFGLTPQVVTKYQKEILQRTRSANAMVALQSLAKSGFVLVEEK
jgi:DNA-binding NarL/FixJ family response regulator